MVELIGQPGDGASMARLETLLGSLTQEVAKLTHIIEEVRRDMGRVSLLEQRHTTTNDALERCFDGLKGAKSETAALEARVAEKHHAYDKYLWLSVGFMTCISVVWSVLGMHLMSNLEDAAKQIAQANVHVQQDRVISSDDVRRIIRDYQTASGVPDGR